MAKRKTKRPRGRPSIYSAKLAGEICILLGEGHYVSTICDLVGIHRDTFYDWIKTNPDFSDSIKKAMAQAEVDAVNFINGEFAAGKGETIWQNRAWFLERRYKDHWGRIDKVEHTGKDGGDIKVVFGKGIDFKGKKD